MITQEKFENVEEMFKEAEDTFRKGIATLNTWSEQALDIIENKPGIVLAAVGISGFITGALLRHGLVMRRSERLPADPVVLFVSGIVAGIVAGPKVIQEALSGINRASSPHAQIVHGQKLSNLMNEKPFQKN